MSIWCLQFFQKTNENSSTWGWIFLFVFLEELRIPKSPFEINWPLIEIAYRRTYRKWLCVQPEEAELERGNLWHHLAMMARKFPSYTRYETPRKFAAILKVSLIYEVNLARLITFWAVWGCQGCRENKFKLP